MRDMKTIAQQLNVTDFPFEIKDKNGNVIYWENSNGHWFNSEYVKGCEGKVVEIDGKKYKLTEV
jgi:hypothetical protein